MKILPFALLLFFIPVRSYACTCVFPTFDEQIKSAIAVFTGEVIDSAQEPEGRLRVDLIIKKKWKGPVVADRISIYTAEDTAACGYPFKEEEEYLVFATGDRQLSVSLCSLTKRLADADEELNKLNRMPKPKEPRDPFSEMKGDKIEDNKPVPKALNITNAVIVGITKKSDEYIALIRALNNKVYFLKVGDKLHDGIVVKIDSNSVTFRQHRGRRSVLIRKELRPFPDE